MNEHLQPFTNMKILFLAASLTLLVLKASGQGNDSTTNRPTKSPRPASAPNQRLSGPDATPDPEMNLRLNALNGVGTAPMIWRIDTRYEGLRGTPYFQPDWANGQIDLTNGRTYRDVPVKFDAHRQVLMLLRPKQGNDSIIIDQRTVRHFQIANADGKSYLFKRYPTSKAADADVQEGYFMVLYEGKTALLKRIVKTFRPADFKGAYSSGTRYDAYTDANAYYVLKPDQTLTKIKLSKKSLLDALDSKSDALKTFADKFGFKSEADAVAVVQQYDSL